MSAIQTTVRDSPEVLTVADAAQLLRVSVSNVYRMAERNELPGAVKVGGQWRIGRTPLLTGLGLAGAA
jgi:excisionase family DNA binding protein